MKDFCVCFLWTCSFLNAKKNIYLSLVEVGFLKTQKKNLKGFFFKWSGTAGNLIYVGAK